MEDAPWHTGALQAACQAPRRLFMRSPSRWNTNRTIRLAFSNSSCSAFWTFSKASSAAVNGKVWPSVFFVVPGIESHSTALLIDLPPLQRQDLAGKPPAGEVREGYDWL